MKIFQGLQNLQGIGDRTQHCLVFIYSSLISYSRNAVYRVALDMHSHSVTYTVFTWMVLYIDAYLLVVHWFLVVSLTSLHISICKKRESFVPWTTLVKKCYKTKPKPPFRRNVSSIRHEYAITSIFILFFVIFWFLSNTIGNFYQSFVTFPPKYEKQETAKVIVTSFYFIIKIF